MGIPLDETIKSRQGMRQ